MQDLIVAGRALAVWGIVLFASAIALPRSLDALIAERGARFGIAVAAAAAVAAGFVLATIGGGR